MRVNKITFEDYKQGKVRRPYELEKDRALKEKIKKASKAIRKKYIALKLGKAEEDETINRLLKPVIDPLRELKSENVIKTENISSPVVVDDIKKIPLKLKKTEEEEEPIDDYEINLNLEQYPSSVMTYIEKLLDGSKDCDETYGVRIEMNKLYVGNLELYIGSNGGISIGNKMYAGKGGLYELLFMKNPKEYTEEDLNNYKEILETSSAHKRNYDATSQLNGTRSAKYKRIIKPLFKGGTFKSHSGSGISSMIYNEKPIEYIYWDDVNELVDRLKLLNASKTAGNTDSHDNEILAILNELREAGIIY